MLRTDTGSYPKPDESIPLLTTLLLHETFSIILSKMLRCYKRSLSLRFSNQNFVCISGLPCVLCTQPPHPPYNVCCRELILKHPHYPDISGLLLLSCLLSQNILLSTMSSNTLNYVPFSNARGQI
jgi:hypothetical protein